MAGPSLIITDHSKRGRERGVRERGRRGESRRVKEEGVR